MGNIMANKTACAALLATLVLAGVVSPAAAAPHWGKFRDDGCINIGGGRRVRVYQAVLWDIPWGYSWEKACSKQPAIVAGVHFPRPTACVKSTIAQSLGVIAPALGTAGLVSKNPAFGAAAVVVGGTTAILNLTGGGALNMWGVFYVSGQCGGQKGQTSFCSSYAKAAVADEKFNQVKGCFSDWRVHSPRAHYDWCRSKSLGEAQQQWNNRYKMIKACRGSRR
jgi:hypothetical protein